MGRKKLSNEEKHHQVAYYLTLDEKPIMDKAMQLIKFRRIFSRCGYNYNDMEKGLRELGNILSNRLDV